MLELLFKKLFSPHKGEHEPDKSLIVVTLFLVIFGLVMLFSASSAVSYARFGNTYHYFTHQLVGLGVGLFLFYLFSRLDYHKWRKSAFLFLICSVFLLLLVFIPGIRSQYGTARSWIRVFGFSFQPSELVKLTFLIYLASWLEAKKKALSSFSSGFIPFLVILGVISALMIAQPDLGTLFIIVVTSLIVFFVGGGKILHIISILSLAGLFLVIILHSHLSYQSDRWRCYQNPNYSQENKCYQLDQSLIAVGSGGWFGRGLGQSREKFMYLPEVWGDSIFPIIAEEIGFVFSSFLILLYLFLFYRGLLIARSAPDLYGSVLATGIIAWLAIQAFLNIGGMINIIPMTGVPLPFISAGGSAVVAALIAMGILVNISKQTSQHW